MSSSGTYGYSLSNAGVLISAFNRCGVRPTALTRDDMIQGIEELNLLLVRWANRAVNLWEVKPFVIQLVAGQALYTAGVGVSNISPYATSMLDVYYSIINGGGAGINIDRIMIPMSRTTYDEFSNKLQPGIPTMYWFEKQPVPQMTIYQPALQGYPTAQIAGHYLSQIQTANLGSGETPDIPYLATAALRAELAAALCTSYTKDAQLRSEIRAEGKEVWTEFADTNREDAPIRILPAMRSGGWSRY